MLVTMMSSPRKQVCVLLAGFMVLALLSPSISSSKEQTESLNVYETSQPNSIEVTPKLSYQIKVHAFLLWTSFGFFIPIGILVIRMSQRAECAEKLKELFYFHVVSQTIAVVFAMIGAIHSFKNFDNSFSNSHQRTGLALYILILVQALTGLFRPHRGVKNRSQWYLAHWLLGTGTCITGIINIYIGLHNYHAKTSRSISVWNALFVAEIAVIAFVYLFQDRWDYMKNQGSTFQIERLKELGTMRN